MLAKMRSKNEHHVVPGKIGQNRVCWLKPNSADRNISYYKKARAIVWKDNWVGLISYNTIVAILSPDNELYKVWDGYSVTTMKHINTFCDDFGIATFSKSEWANFEYIDNSMWVDFVRHHDMEFDYLKF